MESESHLIMNISPNSHDLPIRDVYKCGFLKYFANLPKENNKVASVPLRYWAVFAVINEFNPILELYSDKPTSNSGSSPTVKPFFSFSLKRCLHLCPTIVIEEKENCFEFTITLEQQLIRLVAPTRQAMEEWIDCIKTRLKQMNIIGPQDNYYTKEPIVSFKNKPLLQGARPLPPIPLENPHHQDSSVHLTTSRGNTPSPFLPSSTRSLTNLHSSLSSLSPPLPPPRPMPLVIHSSPLLAPVPGERCSHQTPLPSRPSPPSSDTNDTTQPSYEPIFAPLTTRLASALLEARMNHLPQDEGPPPYEDIERNVFTTTGSSNSSGSNSGSGESFGQTEQTLLSLRESQILRLQREIRHKDGVRVLVRKKDCNDSIALVDYLNCVWVAGWKQKLFPQLHNTFHIGDSILSVCGEKIHNSAQVLRLMKSQPLIVEIVLRRVPHGCVFLIKREHDGQDLGIIREGNTAEVIHVVEGGLAAQKNLTPKALAVDQSKARECNWVITEINNRPLNLFFKANEIRDRLNAVGKDISLLLQPLDLIKALKKRLKSFKNYKDYIVQ